MKMEYRSLYVISLRQYYSDIKICCSIDTTDSRQALWCFETYHM